MIRRYDVVLLLAIIEVLVKCSKCVYTSTHLHDTVVETNIFSTSQYSVEIAIFLLRSIVFYGALWREKYLYSYHDSRHLLGTVLKYLPVLRENTLFAGGKLTSCWFQYSRLCWHT